MHECEQFVVCVLLVCKIYSFLKISGEGSVLKACGDLQAVALLKSEPIRLLGYFNRLLLLLMMLSCWCVMLVLLSLAAANADSQQEAALVAILS